MVGERTYELSEDAYHVILQHLNRHHVEERKLRQVEIRQSVSTILTIREAGLRTGSRRG